MGREDQLERDRRAFMWRIMHHILAGVGGDSRSSNAGTGAIPPPPNDCLLLESGTQLFLEDVALECLELET
jgi:hypothetical protein